MTHPFERAGLGKAPFQCTGVSENVWDNGDGTTKGGGCCDYCSTGIRWEFHIKGSDNKCFKVGCDCVAKTGWGIDKFDDVRKEHAKARRQVGAKIRREARAALWAAEKAERAAARVDASAEWRAEHAELVAKIEAYTGDNEFLRDMAASLKSWGHLTQRQLDAVVRCHAVIARRIAAQANSTHMGREGERLKNALVRVTHCKQVGTQPFYPFAPRYVIGLETQSGNVLSWFTGTAVQPFEAFEEAAFTVKGHDEYRGVKQTTIQRLKFKND